MYCTECKNKGSLQLQSPCGCASQNQHVQHKESKTEVSVFFISHKIFYFFSVSLNVIFYFRKNMFLRLELGRQRKGDRNVDVGDITELWNSSSVPSARKLYNIIKYNWIMAQTERTSQQSQWPTGAGLVMVKNLPFAAAYLGDTFDLAQTNQPEGMNSALLQTRLFVHMGVNVNWQKKKRA